MKEFFIFVGIFAAYIILQKWILPKLGIQTGMSGGCSVEQNKKDKAQPTAESIEE